MYAIRFICTALAAVHAVLAKGDWVPCSSASKRCCNPYLTSPVQYCPKNIKCQECGGSNACECPSSPPPPPPHPPAPQCHVKDWLRKDCGYSGITPKQCADNGCCWEPTIDPTNPQHYAWCFHPMPPHPGPQPPPPPAPQCDVKDRLRADCGYSGITPRQCEDKGCCWEQTSDPTNPQHYAWCFHPRPPPPPPPHPSAPQCDIKDLLRKDCGYSGITPKQCRDNGCWKPTSDPADPHHYPWCFHSGGSGTEMLV